MAAAKCYPKVLCYALFSRRGQGNDFKTPTHTRHIYIADLLKGNAECYPREEAETKTCAAYITNMTLQK